MSHMVIYRGTDGTPGYHQADEVHDAVAFVEQLRNDRGVEEAKIFRMEEVTFEYRPYFRVELVSSERTLSAPAAAPAVSAPATPPATLPESSPVSEPAASMSTVADGAPKINVSGPAASSTGAPNVAASDADSNGDVGARRGLFGR